MTNRAAVVDFAVAGAVHVHSDYSHDGVDSLEVLRDTCIARGMYWVAMTDHAEDVPEDVFAEFQAHCARLSDERFTLIPGLEYKFPNLRGVHLLAIGLEKWIAARTPEQFFEATNGAARLTVLAHPVLCHYQPPQIVIDRIGAVEIWNTRYNGSYLPDHRAIELLRVIRGSRPDVVATVGLDQHDSTTNHNARTWIRRNDLDDPAMALASGRFETTGRGARFAAHLAMDERTLARLRIMRRALEAARHFSGRISAVFQRILVSP